MNVLVTGGAGFIGSHFVDLLTKKKNIKKIIIIDNLEDGTLINLKKALNESKNEIINKNSILKNWNDIEIFECPICLDEFQNNDDIRLLICSHKFHKKCIDLWFNKQLNCPMCKSNLS